MGRQAAAGGSRGVESVSRLSRIAEIPAGSWTKWVVVGFWVVVLVVTLPLSSKLTGAEKNDAKTWLPANAESTKGLDIQSRFQSPNIFPALVHHDRGEDIRRLEARLDVEDLGGLRCPKLRRAAR